MPDPHTPAELIALGQKATQRPWRAVPLPGAESMAGTRVQGPGFWSVCIATDADAAYIAAAANQAEALAARVLEFEAITGKGPLGYTLPLEVLEYIRDLETEISNLRARLTALEGKSDG